MIFLLITSPGITWVMFFSQLYEYYSAVATLHSLAMVSLYVPFENRVQL
jgi:hypothetical protein